MSVMCACARPRLCRVRVVPARRARAPADARDRAPRRPPAGSAPDCLAYRDRYRNPLHQPARAFAQLRQRPLQRTQLPLAERIHRRRVRRINPLHREFQQRRRLTAQVLLQCRPLLCFPEQPMRRNPARRPGACSERTLSGVVRDCAQRLVQALTLCLPPVAQTLSVAPAGVGGVRCAASKRHGGAAFLRPRCVRGTRPRRSAARPKSHPASPTA